MYICALYFQDPEIGSLIIFVIYIFIVIIVIVIVLSQHFGTGVLELFEDIVRYSLSYCNSCEVAGVPRSSG